MHNNLLYTFLRVAPTNPPVPTFVSSFLQTLNLALGDTSVLHKTKYPIASGGHSPPDPLL